VNPESEQMFRRRRRLAIFTVGAIALTSISALSAQAQTEGKPAHGDHQMQQMHSATQKPDESQTMGAPTSTVPTLPGQDAFGAMAEIVAILTADPNTDWNKVNITVLREHLVDMNRVTLEANAQEKNIKGGLEIIVSGQGRTLKAIQNMVLAHAPQLNQLDDWSASANRVSNGARLTVTSKNAAETTRIRGLGFFGLMASGAHHQPHHIGMARGSMVHSQ
jgi:hypothetical protein